MTNLGRDLFYALRRIGKRPAVSTVIVLTLGLGIGVNATFFSGFHGMVLRPLPFTEPERLVALTESQPALRQSWHAVSAANLRDWLAETRVLSGAGAFTTASFNVQSADEPQRLSGAAVSHSLFPVLGVQPALGRVFSAQEDEPNGPRVVLISHDVWRERFGGKPTAVGSTLRLDDEEHEIVGVMPEGFHFPNFGQVWIPLRRSADTPRDDRGLEVIGRLASGVSLDQAREGLAGVAGRLAGLYPATNRGWSVEVRKLHDAWLPPVTKLASASQMVLVSGVLLIVWANVASIVLAQATARRQEMAVRTALGATRGGLMRLMLMESLVLALLGGVLGVVLTRLGVNWLRGVSTVLIPYWLFFDLDAAVLFYTAAVTLATGVALGVLPALRTSRGGQLGDALKSGARTEPIAGGRLRRFLVGAEYALALIILVGALLMVRSYQALQGADLGFDQEKVLTLRLSLTGRAYQEDGVRAAYLDNLVTRLAGLPEVAGAAAASHLPISRDGFARTAVEIEGRPAAPGEEPVVSFRAVTAGYPEVMGIPLTAGRAFTPGESREGGGVALINKSLAARLWPGADPLGRQVRTLQGGAGPWLRVVGVVGDVSPGQSLAGIDPQPADQLYVPMGYVSPLLGVPPRLPSVVVKARIDPAAALPAVRRERSALDPSVPIFHEAPMRRVLSDFYFAQDIWSQMFSAIALAALVIAAVGAYGITSYSVTRRLHEMAIRLSLGAEPRGLLAMVIRQGTRLAVVGIAVGLAGAIPMTLLMAKLLQGVGPFDPVAYGTVVALLVAVGVLASYVPARRAAAVDPMTVLRND